MRGEQVTWSANNDQGGLEGEKCLARWIPSMGHGLHFQKIGIKVIRKDVPGRENEGRDAKWQ